MREIRVDVGWVGVLFFMLGTGVVCGTEAGVAVGLGEEVLVGEERWG
jgi:hypothetical protein